MAKETTPQSLTPVIIQLCKDLNPEVTPLYLEVSPEPWARVNECFVNVERKIKESGGSYENGWLIWQWANMMIEAEAHSVWKSEDGRTVDITPHQENRILFVPDPDVCFDGIVIPSKRAPLTSSPKVSYLIDLLSLKDECMERAGKGKTFSLPVPLVNELARVQADVSRKAGRNDPCPCGSGLKYKKCCGQYDT